MRRRLPPVPPRGRRLLGALLTVAFLFSGDLVRLHGHPDGAPASTDCAACVAGLSVAVEADASTSVPAPAPVVLRPESPPAQVAPNLPFVRQGGLRDPPARAA